VEKTGKVVIVHEAPVIGGFGGEIAAILADKGIDFLEAPVKRVGAPFCPVPSSPEMEQFYLPNAEKMRQLLLNGSKASGMRFKKESPSFLLRPKRLTLKYPHQSAGF
jgi:hypothetical protein